MHIWTCHFPFLNDKKRWTIASHEKFFSNTLILGIKLQSANGNIIESLMLVHDLQVTYIHFIWLSQPDYAILTFSSIIISIRTKHGKVEKDYLHRLNLCLKSYEPTI